LDELNGFGIQFLAQREAIDTEGALGRAIIVIVSAMSELERCIIIERVRAGMRRAKSEGRRIGRAPLQVNRALLLRNREGGMSLNQLAKAHAISKASICRVLREEKEAVSRGIAPTAANSGDNKRVPVPIPLIQ
jgi:DNA invertase Pin-like site-specific DNA recombinase